MTQQRFLILLSFGTWLAGTESRTSLNRLRQSEDKTFDDLLRNVFPQNDRHQGKEEKNLEANFLTQLMEFSSTPNKNTGHSLTNQSSDISTFFDDLIGKSAEEGNNVELFQKMKDNNDFQNLDKNIKKEVMRLSTLQNNEVLADLISLLAPYIEKKSEADQNLKVKVNKNRASEDEMRHTAQLDAKSLKSHAEVDKQTGTKFFDNRPNMTDLLNNIRNITKSKKQQTTVSSLDAELLLDPLIALGERDLYYGPTATYGFKETYLHSASKETRLAANQKASGLIANQRGKYYDSDLQAHDSQDKSSLTKSGRKINRSVKIQKRTYPVVENSGNNIGDSGKVSQPSSKVSSRNSEVLGQAERSRARIPQNNNSRHEPYGGSSEESSDMRKLDLKTEEITALTARIVADIVKEIDKRYRHECEANPTKSPNLTKQTEEQGATLSSDPSTDSSKIDQNNSKRTGQIEKCKSEGYNTLKSLNFPVVTSKLVTKPAGIPLYKIPNTEIYIYDLYPANKSAHTQMKITDQNDLASILDQLIANNSPGLDNHRNKLSDSVLGIDPNESLLQQSIFDKNLLPDFFDSLIQSKSEAATERPVTKSPDLLDAPAANTPDPGQVIPEIEIHIRTVPVGPHNASDDLPPKKTFLGKRDPFSDIFLFNSRNQKNSNQSPKTPYQRKIIGVSQQPVKKKPVMKQQPKLDSDNLEAQKRIKGFWGLKSR